MTRSTRRTAAAAAAAAVIRDEEEAEGSDMQMSASDAEHEPEPEHEAEDEVDEGEDEMNVEEEDDDHEQDVEEEDEIGGDHPEEPEPELSPPPPPAPAAYPRLKIKIKLPASTPSGSAGTISRRSPSGEMSIESEDSSQHSSGSNDDGDDASSLEDSAPTKSVKGKQPAVASTNVKAKMKKPMTARQAVLASVGGGVSSHITLSEPPSTSSKKKHLTDSELALRREETARKRKNLSEKKLEDEKAETINRLLKKQSTRQAKNKRLAATITATASASHTHTHTAAATPAPAASDAEDGDGAEREREGEGEGDAEEDDNKKKEPEMYRWVSNAAGLSFSVPVGVLPSPSEAEGMVVHSSTSVPTTRKASKSIPAQLPKCDVRNCKAVRKYRLVSDWEKGACGMVHLKVLQGRARG